MKNDLKSMIKKAPSGIIEIIATVFNTIKYNWFYILLSILAPTIIYMMGAGGEIISLLFESEYWLSNIIFLVLTLGLMSTTTWLIPSLSVYTITAYSKLVKRDLPWAIRLRYYRQLLKVYSNDPEISQIPSKYLAMLPWTMVCSTVIQYRIGNSGGILFFIINSGLLSLMAFCSALYKKRSKRVVFGTFLLFLACLITFIFMYRECSDSGTAAKVGSTAVWIYIIYLGSMIVTFMFLGTGERWYEDLAANDHLRKTDLRKNNIVHAILFVLNLGSLFWLTYLAINIQLPAVSTLIVILLCLNFYMLVVDTLFTTQWVMAVELRTVVGSDRKWLGYKLFLGTFLFIFIILVLFTNTNNYSHSLPKTAVRETETLEAYFDKWYKVKRSSSVDNVMNVYLVSGQGGGSRAAVYMLAILREIESRDRELYSQTFSISTISGSSAGVGQYIGQHKNMILEDNLRSDTTGRGLENLKLAYSYNYFNSNLLGLLFYDRLPGPIKDLLYKTNNKTYGSFNRNYIQEREELEQLQIFTDRIIGKRSDTNVYSFLQNDILDLYQEKDSFSTPLVFFNTTVLNQGRKGVFSPIKDTNLFSNNVDLLASGKPVSFHFAEISSQSFPLLNNFSSFGADYLGDGGIYENSGISTTTQIYRRLRQHCNDSNYKVRFIILNLLNGANKDEQEVAGKEEPEHDKKSILALLLSAVSKLPFEGHEADAKLSIIQEVAMNNRNLEDTLVRDAVFNIYPAEQFALSRVFCQNTLDSFIAKRKIVASIQQYLDHKAYLRKMDSLNAPKEEAETNIYQLYTQYRNSDDKDNVKAMLQGSEVQNVVSNIRPIDRVVSAHYGNEIRYFHPEDSVKAVKLNETLPRKFKLVYVKSEALQEKTPVGQLELWVDSLGYNTKREIFKMKK